MTNRRNYVLGWAVEGIIAVYFRFSCFVFFSQPSPSLLRLVMWCVNLGFATSPRFFYANNRLRLVWREKIELFLYYCAYFPSLWCEWYFGKFLGWRNGDRISDHIISPHSRILTPLHIDASNRSCIGGRPCLPKLSKTEIESFRERVTTWLSVGESTHVGRLIAVDRNSLAGGIIHSENP